MLSGSVRRVSLQDIQEVENLIEQCLQLYMSQKEVVETLLDQAKIEPGFTELVWQKLEEENREFFRAYHLRLMVKQQINEFNRLLDQQVQLMRQMQPSGVASLPTCNGSYISSLHQNSACYASEHTGPAVKAENVHNPIVSGSPDAFTNGVPYAFTNGGSLLHQSLHTAVQMPALSSRIDAPPSMLSSQSSNMEMSWKCIQRLKMHLEMYGPESTNSSYGISFFWIFRPEFSKFQPLRPGSRLFTEFWNQKFVSTMSSSSAFYSSLSHHLCSRDRCTQRTSLTLDNLGRRFYGCCFYDEVSYVIIFSLKCFLFFETRLMLIKLLQLGCLK